MVNKLELIAIVQKHLDRIVTHMEPSREFVNMHMVAWICENLYVKHVPENIRSEINTIEDVRSAMDLFFQKDNPSIDLIKKHQNLHNKIQLEKTFYLENLTDKLYLTHDEMIDEFKALKVPTDLGLNVHVKEFMKDKKSHEVSVASKIVGILSRTRDKKPLILDFGDGKGYLSTRVSLEFNLKTLGIDASDQNAREAELRNAKLTKLWPHLVKKEASRMNIETPELNSPDEVQDDKKYKTIASYIYGDTDLNTLIDQAYPDEKMDEICLIGLHTCGNLSANSLKHFVSNDRIKMIMNVPCCYNLLFEEFEIDYFNDQERVIDHPDDYGFPLSNYLKERKYRIGRNARMLGTQSFERILNGISNPDESLFYRSIFEKLLRERFRKGLKPHVFRLGKIKRVKSLEEYIKKACQRLNITYDLTEEEIRQLEEDHKFDKEAITFHYFIRLLSAKTIETIIHLDRYLYLLENDVEHVYLVKLFDSVISPRNFAILGIK
ncbi:probable methyltransferase-like protein 25 [Chironomus tepperi]|uniref:probable methyltransferase-like protein 25 n=1 Tax=Chironomus tepperi TaxID=113505 RepID=UPI00391FA9AE